MARSQLSSSAGVTLHNFSWLRLFFSSKTRSSDPPDPDDPLYDFYSAAAVVPETIAIPETRIDLFFDLSRSFEPALSAVSRVAQPLSMTSPVMSFTNSQ